MRDARDYKVEISSASQASSKPQPPSHQPSPEGRGGNSAAQPFVSVLFKCGNVYQRIYRSADGTRYDGRCPKCGRAVRFVVGEGGTSERFFVVE